MKATITRADIEDGKRPATTVDVGTIEFTPGNELRVVSDCGVVKVYSSRDGCLFAHNSGTARRIARDLGRLIDEAARLTDLRGYGKVLDHNDLRNTGLGSRRHGEDGSVWEVTTASWDTLGARCIEGPQVCEGMGITVEHWLNAYEEIGGGR